MDTSHDIRAVILAGGSGTRLWPLSRTQSPKQFSRVLGDQTLLEATVSRLEGIVPSDRILVVTSEATAFGEGFHSLAQYQTISEPVARNTAPAIAIAALRFKLDGADPIMLVMPSDHIVRDVPGFQAALRRAIRAADDGKLVTFGIEPTHPETGFGYMQAYGGDEISAVVSFREKPDRETAERFLADGSYYWNSGMFVWRASTILSAIRRELPALADVVDAIARDALHEGFNAALTHRFSAAPAISIDHGVLEKSNDVVMVRGRFGWSDVGNWDSVFNVSEKDSKGNVVRGNVIAIDCVNSLVRSESRLVAATGIEDLSVVETADAVLIARRGSGQNVAEIVREIARREGTQHLVHTTVQRPWGSYTVVEEGPGYKIKRIEVGPGGRLSMQRHKHRSEHWVVVEGEALVTRDGDQMTLRPNESTFIPAGAKHRLENVSLKPLQIVEVQVGSYVGEDDIERFDDQYGRSTELKG